MKTIEQLAKQKTYTRNDLLIIFDRLLRKMVVEGFSRVLDVQEELGFGREEEPKEN